MEEKMNIEPTVIEEPKKTKTKKPTLKNKECKVLRFNNKNKTLDIMFDEFGLHFNGVKNDYSNVETVNVKYKGTIGKANFSYQLDE